MIVDVRVKPGSRDELTRAYAALRQRAREQPGFISHQLCQSLDDPGRWMVLSEWETFEDSEAWDRSEDHARLLGPMRACFAQASRTGFHVRDGAGR